MTEETTTKDEKEGETLRQDALLQQQYQAKLHPPPSAHRYRIGAFLFFEDRQYDPSRSRSAVRPRFRVVQVLGLLPPTSTASSAAPPDDGSIDTYLANNAAAATAAAGGHFCDGTGRQVGGSSPSACRYLVRWLQETRPGSRLYRYTSQVSEECEVVLREAASMTKVQWDNGRREGDSAREGNETSIRDDDVDNNDNDDGEEQELFCW